MPVKNTLDTIEKIEENILQNGNTHKLVYLNQVEQNNWDKLIPQIRDLAKKKDCEKILGCVPEDAKPTFQSHGYRVEAKVPGLYNGKKTGYFLADYIKQERSFCYEQEQKTIESIKTIALAANKADEDSYFKVPAGFKVHKLDKTDLLATVHLYKKDHNSHKFPINKAKFLSETKERNYMFYGLYREDELLVTAILKLNKKESNIEIIDFITDPDYNGQNLSYYLIQEIKKDMDNGVFKTIYSLVRATSYGLNITYSKHGFLLGGTLVNNTVIRNTVESMNVWYYKFDQSNSPL